MKSRIARPDHPCVERSRADDPEPTGPGNDTTRSVSWRKSDAEPPHPRRIFTVLWTLDRSRRLVRQEGPSSRPIYLHGVDHAEIIETVHARGGPMIHVSSSLHICSHPREVARGCSP